MRYSLNSLRNSFELGVTSNWVVSFSKADNSSIDPGGLNIIRRGEENVYSPVQELSFDEDLVVNREFTVGPGLNFKIPVYSQPGVSISVVFYDNDSRDIKRFLLDWIGRLGVRGGRSPVLNSLKSDCLVLNVHRFGRGGEGLPGSSFYVVPGDALAYRGDQEFAADTVPVTFNVLGVHV